MTEELWMEVHDIVIKTIPKEKKSKKEKWLSEEAANRIVVKSKGEKERYTHLNSEP